MDRVPSSVPRNWCGYVRTGSNVTHVTGTWTVPMLSPSTCTNAYSATWVGIDGWSDNAVEQLGTDQDIINGVQSNYAWWEMYPHSSAMIGPVSTGASITATVDYDVNSGTFTLSMSGGINFTSGR